MTTSDPREPRDRESWALPVDRLSAALGEASRDTVTGRHLSGPIQGFGRLWRKTFRVRLEGVGLTPEEVVARWKADMSSFWPRGSAFYAPLAGIAPGEVALLEIAPLPGAPLKMSTGVLVIYVDRESFAFMTPEGHALSGWITFSAYREDAVTVAQAQAFERTADPLTELAWLLGANRANDRFWKQTLKNLARSVGVAWPIVEAEKVCVDRRRQWRSVRNLRDSPVLGMVKASATMPIRWLQRTKVAQSRNERDVPIMTLGRRVHLFVRPARREAFTALFRDVLGCVVMEEDSGRAETRAVVRFDDGSSLSVEFTDLAPDTEAVNAVDDERAYRGPWIEFRTHRLEDLQAALRKAGIYEFRRAGGDHVYFCAPGGQVFRLVDVDYPGP